MNEITGKLVLSPKAEQIKKLVAKAIAGSPTGVSFFKINKYTNKETGAVKNYLINLGINYEKSKLQDIEFLRNLDVTTLKDVKSSKVELEKAKTALILSLEKPHTGMSNGQKDAYTQLPVKGLKIHNVNEKLYVYGYIIKSELAKDEQGNIINEGEKKADTRKPETKVKDELRALLKTSKFVQFALENGHELKTNGETLEL